MLNKFGFGIILLCLVMFAGVSAKAAVYTVDKTDDSLTVQNCTAAANDCSLRSALFLANRSSADDTINFDPAIFNTPREIQITTSEQFVITNNGALTISGPGANLLSINGLNTVRVFNVTGGTASISGLTIRNGLGGGGGVRNAGNLTVSFCEIKSNTGGTFAQFLSGGGGGILNEGTLNLFNSNVSGNFAVPNTQSSGVGGGILNTNGGTANIVNSTVSGNKVSTTGGGGGGGIWNEGINGTASATMNLINSTVAFNSIEATDDFPDCRGGGINNNGGTLTARNTIIASNGFNCSRAFAADYYGRLASQGYNLIGTVTPFFTEIQGDTTGNITNVNALLAPLANNGGTTQTHALQTNSPAINAGSNAKAVDQNNNPLTTDQRGAGFPRINNGTVDIGAYETLLLPANTTTTITSDTPDPSQQGQSVTVTYTVTAAAGTPTGNVTVTDGVNSCVGTVAAGQCSLALTTAGNRTLTANYGGDANFNPSVSAGEPHTVNPNAPLVLVVDNTSDDIALSACTSAANDCSLRGAIARANAVSTNDTINFDAGVFNVARTIIASNGELAVTNNGGLTINGTGANLLNISGGGGPNRVFNFNTVSNVVLNNLNVSGGNATDGGGILNNSTPLTINYCQISGNNVTGFGGGIYNVGGTTNVNNSTVSGNTAGNSGGGIANGGSPSVLNVSNSTISGNTSSGTGGGGIFTNGQVTIYNATIANNTANGDGTNTGIGGGISNFSPEAVSLGNTIVANNNAPNSPDFRGFLTSLGYNLIGNTGGTGIVGNTNGNLLNVNPMLGALGNNGGATQTHRLLSGSPAINAGNNSLAVNTNNQPLTTDQRGAVFSRIVGTSVDIGALENELPNVTENPQSQTVSAGAIVTFTARAGVFAENAPGILNGGQALPPGQFLISPNYRYKLIYQTDGNLVLYRGDGVVLKNFNTQTANPGQAVMQTDGNFVVYDGNNNVQFSTGTFGNPGATLEVQSDGNIVVYSSARTPLYNTGTNFTGNDPIPAVQWQVSTDGGMNFTNISDTDRANVSGATTPVLTFIAETSDDGDQFRAVFTNTFGATASAPATLTVLAPTAAGVSVSGRITSGKTGLDNAVVTLTGADGFERTVRTNSFGFYRFDDIEVGRSYTMSVQSRRYHFTPQIISVNDDIANLNFTTQ